MKYVLSGVFCCILSWCNALGQSRTDSILTTKGAVTLITCGSAISTFQIGDGKNADYDYRIVDGNVVFIRPIVGNPRATNLVVREGTNIHYLILAYRDRVELSRLKYTLSAGGKSSSGATGAGTAADEPVAGQPQSETAQNEDEAAAAAAANVDTTTVGNIAEDFRKQRRNGHLYETTADGITLTFLQAMSLNNLIYYCFRIRNRGSDPYAFNKVTLMQKVIKDTAALYAMPVVYRRGPATIDANDEQSLVFVTPSRPFTKKDEIIMVMYNKANQNQVVLYTPASALPKYMLSK
ncbi:MAG TPA: hypothetical protein VJ720_05785 [Chitinophaga sp.]|nr:hypothetical protein [Chitinophaga sp.]